MAATAVHYINEVLQDMATFGTEEYSFADHAKHWSELKGYALGLQFNPRSPLDEEAFTALHASIGQAPALPGHEEVEAYRGGLLSARQALGDAYGFSAEDLGDDDGLNGW